MIAQARKEGSNEIVTTRVFEAPRELVFAAWTDPAHLSRWWGPGGFTTTTSEHSLKKGGVWRFVMHGPNGVDYANRIVYDEVVRPERLEYTHRGEEDFEHIFFRSTITFEEKTPGKTLLTMRAQFASAEAREQVIRENGAMEGGVQTLERLAQRVSEIATDGEALTISRTFKAPRDLVWKVHTEAAHLSQWWGPKGFEFVGAKVDLRPGGLFHYGMRSPDGKQMMWGKFVYREIEKPSRLVYVSSFSDEKGSTLPNPWGMKFPLEVLNTVTLCQHLDFTTVYLTGVPLNASDAERKGFRDLHESMQQGFGGTYDQLETYLKKVQS